MKRHFVLVHHDEDQMVSPIKQILIDILQTRCGVKRNELEQYQYMMALEDIDQEAPEAIIKAQPSPKEEMNQPISEPVEIE